MSRGEQESGLSAVLVGAHWQAAAWRAIVVFVAAYVLPTMLLASTSRLAAFLRLAATVLAFVLTTIAVYRWLQWRAAEEWAPDDEVLATPIGANPPPSEAVAAAPEVATPLALEVLGQAALERVCIALYRFNGLNSQTVASAVGDAYRIRLVPRNTDKAIALLRCIAGSEVQGAEAYKAVLLDMADEGLPKAFLIAPAGFRAEIAAEARAQHVTLVDLKLLQAMIERLPDAAREAVLGAAA